MNPNEASALIRLLKEAVCEISPEASALDDRLSEGVRNLANIFGAIREVATQMKTFNENITIAADQLLEATSITVLNRENAKLTSELTSLRVKHGRLAAVVRDLSSPCIGCKKAPWAPHAPNCEWASAASEAMREALDKDGTEHSRETPSPD